MIGHTDKRYDLEARIEHIFAKRFGHTRGARFIGRENNTGIDRQIILKISQREYDRNNIEIGNEEQLRRRLEIFPYAQSSG